ncbi:hypothetical protein NL676_038310 [Syzygium grande]|nr:hypothetical protein NL676_038310 [Syzygium grande]
MSSEAKIAHPSATATDHIPLALSTRCSRSFFLNSSVRALRLPRAQVSEFPVQASHRVDFALGMGTVSGSVHVHFPTVTSVCGKLHHARSSIGMRGDPGAVLSVSGEM